MANLFNFKNWLKDFLSKRMLESPDKRHIFSYQITPNEFISLENGLLNNVIAIRRLGIKNPLTIWKENNYFNALFLLYSAICWQQKYNGSSWSYGFILGGIGITDKNSYSYPVLQYIIKKGLEYWGLNVNDCGLTYLGAIAREAGIPQKLLVENRGSIGRILHTVLGEAINSYPNSTLIKRWIENCKNLMPQSIRNNDYIIDALADSIIIIMDIKKKLMATTLDAAINELDEKDPGWRSKFPLPLYDDLARNLISSLLEDAANSINHKQCGEQLSARRYICRVDDQDWEIQTRIDLPSKISIIFDSIKPRILSLCISSGKTKYETILKKYADNDFYFSTKKQNIIFRSTDALRELTINCATSSGIVNIITCIGNTELDADLPWIFEGEKYDYRFRQQGGGSVHGDVIYIALPKGWESENAEDVGTLRGMDRRIIRMAKSGKLKKGPLEFSVGTASINREEYSWSRENRFLGVETINPVLAFRGFPRPVFDTENKLSSPHGQILWKTSVMESFSDSTPEISPAGVFNVWFKTISGASIRNHMLILPKNATVSFIDCSENGGQIRFEHWRAVQITLCENQEGIKIQSSMDEDCLKLDLKILSGYMPPATVDLMVHWRENMTSARIRVPFPHKGARLFDPSGQEISSGRQICVFKMHGLRLHCFGLNVRRMALRISSSSGLSIRYPLEIQEGGTIIRLLDWQSYLLEMLTLESGINAYVSLDILFDDKEVAHWQVARHAASLTAEGSAVTLIQPGYNDSPSEGYAIKALLLDRPEEDAIMLENALPANSNAYWWEVEESIDRAGSWLIFDDNEETYLKPLLWKASGNTGAHPINSLQAAIAEEDQEIREQALAECLRQMECSLDMSEWSTLTELFKKTQNLPLGTLDVWKILNSFPGVMALIAFHPQIPFNRITSRISIEMPFLWNFVSRKEWENAGIQIKAYFEKIIPGEMAVKVWQEHMRLRMEELAALCPSINAILRISMCLFVDEPQLKAVKSYFIPEVTKRLIFEGENCEMQKLMRRHADDNWPTYFQMHVDKGRKISASSAFMPFPQDWKMSILGLPILLALQAYGSVDVFEYPFNNTEMIFHIREHMHFDSEWFEQVSNITAYCCASTYSSQKG